MSFPLQRPCSCRLRPLRFRIRLRHASTDTASNLPARTRFAPSPTGYLHLGSLRTALFNYLLARRTGGQFILRIEDTDKSRTIPDAETRLMEELRWAGLQWDEGPEVGGPFGPYKQSQRTKLYHEHAQKLIDSDHAYRCFCSEPGPRVPSKHFTQSVRSRCNRRCAAISRSESDQRAAAGTPHVVRLRAPDAWPEYSDMVFGHQSRIPLQKHNNMVTFEDFILIKSDGQPTYHFANVVDDHHMEITHVIRGNEWLTSTPKHVFLYQAFDWVPPMFAHVNLLVDDSGNKLSKRNSATEITHFREKLGILPGALTNFAALLGWSHRGPSDYFTPLGLIRHSSFAFTRGNAIVSTKKLFWLNGRHARQHMQTGGLGFEQILDSILRELSLRTSGELASVLGDRSLRDYTAAFLKQGWSKYLDSRTFVRQFDYMFARPRLAQGAVSEEMVCAISDCLASADWERGDAKDLRAKLDSLAMGYPEHQRSIWRDLRTIITGGRPGPSMDIILCLLGKREVFRRLEAARGSIEAAKNDAIETNDKIASEV